MEKKDLFIKRKTGGMQTPEMIVHQLKNGGELPLFHYPLLDETGIVRHCFTTRYGGVSEGMFSKLNLSFTRGDVKESVEENYRRIAEAMGVPYEKIVCSDQTHTTNVRVVTQADAGTGIIRPKDYTDVDGLITNVPEITLATFYADCVPLYFVDPVHHAIGLSHSGWRGTVARMGKCTLEAMRREYGTKAADVYCAIGPSICQDCYEVSEDVADAFKEEFGAEISQDDSTSCYSWNGKSILTNKGNGKYQLDLWGANRLVLLDAGILPEHLAVTNVCTKCNPDLLYSHRVMGDKRGNLAAFLSLK